MPADAFRPDMTRRTLLGTGLAGTGLGLGAAMLPFGTARAQPASARLRLLATSDLHGTIRDFDYIKDRPDPTIGLVRTAALIDAARAEAGEAAVLLFDCGDLLQGSPLADWIAFERGIKEGEIHPVFAAMGSLGYDAATLGEHDFDYGVEFLEACLSAAPFPVIATNVTREGGGTFVRRTLLLDRTVGDGATIRVGLLGFLPPQTLLWSRDRLMGRIAIGEIVAAAEAAVPNLRAEGADIIVALCHAGIATGGGPGGESENAALALARVPGIDAILAGHQHLVFPGPAFAGIDGVDAQAGRLAGVPAVMPGFWGSHLGIIDLALDRDADGAWRVAAATVEARPITGPAGEPLVEPVAAVAAVVVEAHEATRRYAAQPVGETTGRIASHWALIADDPGLQLVNAAQMAHAQRFVRGTVDEILPLLAAASPFRAGGRDGRDAYVDIPAGPIPLRAAADLCPHPSRVAVLRISGAELREWLEFAAGLFNRIDPARRDPQPLIDPDFPIAQFDVIDGVSYRIDVTQPRRYDPSGRLVDPSASRIRDLNWNLMPVEDTNLFLVATSQRRASGAGNVPGLAEATRIAVSPDMMRDVLGRWLFEQGTVTPTVDRNWSIMPLPDGVIATYDTAPAAGETVPRGINATPVGPTPEGFLRFRVAFG